MKKWVGFPASNMLGNTRGYPTWGFQRNPRGGNKNEFLQPFLGGNPAIFAKHPVVFFPIPVKQLFFGGGASESFVFFGGDCFF